VQPRLKLLREIGKEDEKMGKKLMVLIVMVSFLTVIIIPDFAQAAKRRAQDVPKISDCYEEDIEDTLVYSLIGVGSAALLGLIIYFCVKYSQKSKTHYDVSLSKDLTDNIFKQSGEASLYSW